jgi:hypothetical protein
MSTGALIQVGGLSFFFSHDGYPFDVQCALDIERARKKAKKNPDYSIPDVLKYELMNDDIPHSEWGDFPAEYFYKVDEEGKLYVKNPKGNWAEFRFVTRKNKEGHYNLDHLIVVSSDGMERVFDDWEHYTECFLCDCKWKTEGKMTRNEYAMVEIEHGVLEEHLICRHCGKDEGAI